MQKPVHQTYFFDEFTLDLTRGSLLRGATEIKLRPKSFDVLKYLIENNGRLVTKDELIEAVWTDTAVTDDSLVQCLKDIRRALDDDGQTFIKTIPRRGYIFEKEVRENGSLLYTEETSGVRLVIEETIEGSIETKPREQGDEKLLAASPRRRVAVSALITVAALALIGGLAYGLFVFYRQPPVSPFKSVSIKRLTTDGKAVTVAVSPDGKYFAYAISDGGRQSLWIRQIAAVNNVQIVAPSDVQYGSLTFSPDGNFLYYVQNDVLFQAGTLGGATRKLWENVNGKVTFSPDGKRLAFVRRGTGDKRGTRLVLANSDGTGEEQILAYRKPPESFALTGCAWSPDGETLVCAGGDNPLFGNQYPLVVRVSDGAQTILTKKRWNLVKQSAWLPDGSGFVMSAYDNTDAGAQLWYVTFPGGVPVRIYNDLNDYGDVSLTANAETLLAIQREPQLNLYTLNLTDEARQIKQITFGDSRDGWECVTTTPDGRIVYASEAGGTRDLWIMDADGAGKKQLTFDEPMEGNASVSPDGRSIAFGVASQGIWRIDLDGGGRRQLTERGMFPEYSRDGGWIFYTLPRDGWKMWKVPAEGGESLRVTDFPAIQPAVSPDGKLIAYMNFKNPNDPKLEVMPVEGGEPVKVFDILPLPGRFDVAWSPDGNSIAYKANENGIQKIVSQPFDGGAAQILFSTKSEAEGIAGWTFSRDGKLLYISVGPINQNVVMFSLNK